ncbi:MAG: hypothetical protein JW959_04335 [Pirellulales bacterium]|nr:hypothetical protein [Pirellulales bacterium]
MNHNFRGMLRKTNRIAAAFAIVFSTALASGCNTLPWAKSQPAAPLPRLLPPSPTLEQVIEVVNRNNSQIRSFSSPRASIDGTGFPSLRASVAFQRPWRLRLRAETGLTGAEFDLGSNDQLFWFWVRRNQPPAVYFCRHDRIADSQALRMTPLEPQWLIEAFGIAEFDASLPHQGPYQLADDRLRIDTIRETPEGPTTKVTIVDGSQGWILEQHLFDARRQLAASSLAGGHRRDPLSGLVMPTVVRVNYPAGQVSMRINLGNVEINRLSGDASVLWTMPRYPGAALVDLADPNFRPPPSQSAAASLRSAPQSNWRRPTR